MNIFQKIVEWFKSIFKMSAGGVVPVVDDKTKEIPPPVILNPAPGKKRLIGIDVYNGDKHDWEKAKPDFVIAKATQGAYHVDASFESNRAKAKQLGLPFGAYHFSVPGSGSGQAEYFCDVVGKLNAGDLPPVLDWEEYKNGMIEAGQALIWLQYVEKMLGMKPMIYCGYSKVNDMNLPSIFAEYPLWFAHPGNTVENPGKIPRPWKSCVFLQSSFGEDGGAFGLDQDQFLGSKEDLQKWLKK